jgi:hypothetical protein
LEAIQKERDYTHQNVEVEKQNEANKVLCQLELLASRHGCDLGFFRE